jgi:hypothetical protein
VIRVVNLRDFSWSIMLLCSSELIIGHIALRLSKITTLGCFLTASAYLAKMYSSAVSMASTDWI